MSFQFPPKHGFGIGFWRGDRGGRQNRTRLKIDRKAEILPAFFCDGRDAVRIRIGADITNQQSHFASKVLRHMAGNSIPVTFIENENGNDLHKNHWHQNEDEFVIVLSGEVVLVEGETETPLKAGECAGFKAGEPTGHHILNKSSDVAILFEIGTRCDNEVCHYTGLDFTYRKVKGVVTFVNKDGSIAS